MYNIMVLKIGSVK